MRKLAWVAGGALGAVIVAPLLLLGLMIVFAESGVEVVTLRTTDAAGATSDTRLWVVEDSGYSWLWAATPDRAWVQRLRTHPEVQLVRDGGVARYRAVPVESEEARQRIGCRVIWRYGVPAYAMALIHHGILRHAPTAMLPIRLELLEAHRTTLP